MKKNISQSDNNLLSLSVIVPLYNEQDNILILYNQLRDVLKKLDKKYEIIFVDDGSKDNTFKLLENVIQQDSTVKVVKLKKNFGQTPALVAGIDYAEGEIIITMDGDLQHDPYDIPNFLIKIDEGYDIVSGWRQKRVDSFFYRRLPSMVANKLMAVLSGVNLHDFGTTFKAYRKNSIKNIELSGELHRFIPALASQSGARIAEIPIKNVVREKGSSNYGLSRIGRVICDLLLVKYLISFSTKPLYFFGIMGVVTFLLGVIIQFSLFVKKLLFWESSLISQHGPLLLLSILLIVFGVQSFTFGIIGEMLSRIYHSSRKLKIYHIESVLGKER